MDKHRHQEFIMFLNDVERAMPVGKIDPCHPRQLRHPQAPDVPAVAGQSSALGVPLHPDIGVLAQRRRRLLLDHHAKGHPARRLPIRRELEEAIRRSIQDHNRHAKPFVWTKTPDQILQKLRPHFAPSEWVSALESAGEANFEIRAAR
jgi:hypothetical protein